jgi:hypothetical protein
VPCNVRDVAAPLSTDRKAWNGMESQTTPDVLKTQARSKSWLGDLSVLDNLDYLD